MNEREKLEVFERIKNVCDLLASEILNSEGSLEARMIKRQRIRTHEVDDAVARIASVIGTEISK